jgi:hypothetical protein
MNSPTQKIDSPASAFAAAAADTRAAQRAVQDAMLDLAVPLDPAKLAALEVAKRREAFCLQVLLAEAEEVARRGA